MVRGATRKGASMQAYVRGEPCPRRHRGSGGARRLRRRREKEGRAAAPGRGARQDESREDQPAGPGFLFSST